jgi:hypothetical protein
VFSQEREEDERSVEAWAAGDSAFIEPSESSPPKAGPQRSMPVRQWQEIQEVLRRLIDGR